TVRSLRSGAKAREPDKIRIAFGKASLLGVGAITIIIQSPCNSWEGTCARTLWSPVLSLLHFQIRKSHQVSRTHVGNSPEFESITIPVQDIITILSETFRGCGRAGFRRPDKQVNNM